MVLTYRKFRRYRKRNFRRGIGRSEIKSLKNYAKNKRKDKRIMMVNKAYKHGDIIAPMYITPLDYVDNAIAFNGLAVVSQVYRGNGLQDPDQSGSGHQPMGYDEITSLYLKYRVYASSIEVMVSPDDSSVDVQNIIIVVFPATGTTIVSNIATALEQPYAKVVHRNLYSGNPKLKHYMSTATMFGIRRETVKTAENYAALSSTLPAQQWYWHVVVGSQDGSAAIDAHASFRIRYYSEFYERLRLNQS